jgi:hypothetical protein
LKPVTKTIIPNCFSTIHLPIISSIYILLPCVLIFLLDTIRFDQIWFPFFNIGDLLSMMVWWDHIFLTLFLYMVVWSPIEYWSMWHSKIIQVVEHTIQKQMVIWRLLSSNFVISLIGHSSNFVISLTWSYTFLYLWFFLFWIVNIFKLSTLQLWGIVV